jgi:hypothetical protein
LFNKFKKNALETKTKVEEGLVEIERERERASIKNKKMKEKIK